MNLIYQGIWGFFQTQIKNSLMSLCQQILKLMSSGLSGFWSETLIKAFLDFSKWTNMVVLAVSILFMLFDMAEENASGKSVDYSIVFTNTFKAVIFAEFNALFAQLSMSLADIVTTKLNFKLPENTDKFFNPISSYTSSADFLIFMFLAVLIATVVFFFMSINRYGAMYIHILSSSFYITDIVRGDTTSIGSWLRQMIAISGTYIFQYIAFYCGLYYLLDSKIVMCAVLWAGMFSVSKILQKFGYSTGTKGMLSSFNSMASQGISLLSKV